jgi:hypothetical protein
VLLQALAISSDQALGVNSLHDVDEYHPNCIAQFKRHTQILLLASSSLMPLRVKNESSCFATPIPADPAPKNKILWSVKGVPAAAEESLAAFKKPESTTEPTQFHVVRIRNEYRIEKKGS